VGIKVIVPLASIVKPASSTDHLLLTSDVKDINNPYTVATILLNLDTCLQICTPALFLS
jgi:hypothetical protein